jgi:hypothetical protein
MISNLCMGISTMADPIMTSRWRHDDVIGIVVKKNFVLPGYFLD